MADVEGRSWDGLSQATLVASGHSVSLLMRETWMHKSGRSVVAAPTFSTASIVESGGR